MTLRSSGKKEKVYEKGSEKNAVIFQSVLNRESLSQEEAAT